LSATQYDSRLSADFGRVAAFFRRDLLVAWSYRVAFIGDIFNLVAQVVVFSFVARMVDPATLPTYGGRPPDYMAFVTVGIALTAFLQLGLGRMSSAIRGEQLIGTLESVLVSPIRPAILLFGCVAYDLVYIPIRTAIFIASIAAVFGFGLNASGAGEATVIVLLFMPLVWGLGIASAAAVLTFRRGSGLVGPFAFGLTLLSGAYFPLSLLPGWLQALARANPIAIALDGARDALLGGAGWADPAPKFVFLAAGSIVAVVGGTMAFNLALHRERRLGTIGLY
jgi:ABC-2 type transport system permease protein